MIYFEVHFRRCLHQTKSVVSKLVKEDQFQLNSTFWHSQLLRIQYISSTAQKLCHERLKVFCNGPYVITRYMKCFLKETGHSLQKYCQFTIVGPKSFIQGLVVISNGRCHEFGQ